MVSLQELDPEIRSLLPKLDPEDKNLASKIEASRLIIKQRAKANLWYFAYYVCLFKDIKILST